MSRVLVDENIPELCQHGVPYKNCLERCPGCDCLCEQHHVGDDGECWQCDDCPEWGAAKMRGLSWEREAIIDEMSELLNQSMKAQLEQILMEVAWAGRAFRRSSDQVDALRYAWKSDMFGIMYGARPAFPGELEQPRSLRPLLRLLWTVCRVMSPHLDPKGCLSCYVMRNNVRERGDPMDCPQCTAREHLSTAVRLEDPRVLNDPDLHRVTYRRRDFRRVPLGDSVGRRWWVWLEYV